MDGWISDGQVSFIHQVFVSIEVFPRPVGCRIKEKALPFLNCASILSSTRRTQDPIEKVDFIRWDSNLKSVSF
jgi:hypothetical protein